MRAPATDPLPVRFPNGWPQILVTHAYPNAEEPDSSFDVRGYPTHYLIEPAGRVLVGADRCRRLHGDRLLETQMRLVYAADIDH